MIRHFYFLKWFALFLAVLICGIAQNRPNENGRQNEVRSIDQCFKHASIKHGVSERYLRAIGWAESRFQSDRVHVNVNGSVDVGLMQINSIHFPLLEKIGVSADQLFDPCTNIDVGARMYAAKVNRHGDTLRAIGAYNSENTVNHPHYVKRIKNALKEMPEFDV